MSKFRAGDRVKNKNGSMFSNGDHVVTIQRIDSDIAWPAETRTMTPVSDLDHSAQSPIRTVTRREIVPGVYGPIKLKSQTGEAVWIETAHLYNAEELREAAHILNQIAEVLEDG